MNEMEKARRDIDEIDRRMAELFVHRMEATARVLSYKRKNSLPIFDPERERDVLEKGMEQMENKAYFTYYEDFLRCLMDIAKRYQQDLIEGGKDL